MTDDLAKQLAEYNYQQHPNFAFLEYLNDFMKNCHVCINDNSTWYELKKKKGSFEENTCFMWCTGSSDDSSVVRNKLEIPESKLEMETLHDFACDVFFKPTLFEVAFCVYFSGNSGMFNVTKPFYVTTKPRESEKGQFYRYCNNDFHIGVTHVFQN